MKKHNGNRHLIVRAGNDLHAKLGRVVAHTGADKSACVRAALEFLSEDQIAVIVAQRGQQQRVVNHAQ